MTTNSWINSSEIDPKIGMLVKITYSDHSVLYGNVVATRENYPRTQICWQREITFDSREKGYFSLTRPFFEWLNFEDRDNLTVLAFPEQTV